MNMKVVICQGCFTLGTVLGGTLGRRPGHFVEAAKLTEAWAARN